MSLDDFLLLGNAHRRGALHVRSRTPIQDPFALVGGEVVPEQALEFGRHSGSTPMDLIGTTNAVLYLISERFAEILRSRGFTGWGRYDARVETSGGALRNYGVLYVKGRCGPVDDSRSERAVIERGGVPRTGWRGIFFDPATWDGSDVFLPLGTGLIIVTSEVGAAIEAGGLTNIKLQPLSKVERLVL